MKKIIGIILLTFVLVSCNSGEIQNIDVGEKNDVEDENINDSNINKTNNIELENIYKKEKGNNEINSDKIINEDDIKDDVDEEVVNKNKEINKTISDNQSLIKSYIYMKMKIIKNIFCILFKKFEKISIIFSLIFSMKIHQ